MNKNVARLFSGNNIAFLATSMPDGSPQVSPVWTDYENGCILINTAEGRVKHKNILFDPRVAVSVVSHDNPHDMVSVRGTVEMFVPDYNYKHVDGLTKKYLGRNRYPFRRVGEKRTVMRIRPTSVYIMPRLDLDDFKP